MRRIIDKLIRAFNERLFIRYMKRKYEQVDASYLIISSIDGIIYL